MQQKCFNYTFHEHKILFSHFWEYFFKFWCFYYQFHSCSQKANGDAFLDCPVLSLPQSRGSVSSVSLMLVSHSTGAFPGSPSIRLLSPPLLQHSGSRGAGAYPSSLEVKANQPALYHGAKWVQTTIYTDINLWITRYWLTV